MRRFTIFIILCLIMILCFAIPVFANILSDVASGATNWVIENALASLISIIFMLIGAFFGKTVWGKLAIKAKVPIIELKDVVIKVHQARLGNSPGGTNSSMRGRNRSRCSRRCQVETCWHTRAP